MKDINIWHIGNGRYYAKVPYISRGIMGDRKPMMTYKKDGKLKYLQYEITKREAEKLMNYGTLNQKKPKNKKLFQKAM
jgi:hypothetical protein